MRRCETDRTRANCPRYTLGDKMISLVAEITEVATHLEMRESAIDPLLRKKNRLKTIHSSLAIEQNLEYPQFLTLETGRMPDSIGQDAFSEVK